MTSKQQIEMATLKEKMKKLSGLMQKAFEQRLSQVAYKKEFKEIEARYKKLWRLKWQEDHQESLL